MHVLASLSLSLFLSVTALEPRERLWTGNEHEGTEERFYFSQHEHKYSGRVSVLH